MLYVHIASGGVDVGPGPLPASWKASDGTTHMLGFVDDLAALGWYPYQLVTPATTPHQKLVGSVAGLEDGTWVETRIVVDMTPAEAAAADDAQWQAIRAQRDQHLLDCDWIVIRGAETGAGQDPAWIAYRQALRDITLQANPWAIAWPVAPADPGAKR